MIRLFRSFMAISDRQTQCQPDLRAAVREYRRHLGSCDQHLRPATLVVPNLRLSSMSRRIVRTSQS